METPTPPYKDVAKQIKVMAMMIGGGILAGLAWALFIEFYLDTSVRRKRKIESRLKLPLLISIPDISRNGHRRMIRRPNAGNCSSKTRMARLTGPCHGKPAVA